MEQILECVPEVSSDPLDILTRGYVPALIMYTAVQFDVFSHFTEPGLEEEVVGKLGLSPVLGAKFFNALVAIGLLEKNGGRYINTPLAQTYLVPDQPYYQGHLMNLLASQIEKWSKLPVVLKNYAGKEPECGLPDSFYKNTFDENFVNAMAETALLGSLQNTVKVITGLPEFSQAKKFLDLGGGPGLFAIALAQKNKELMATLFDLPQVTEVAQKFIDQYKMNNQVSVRPGNYLVDDLGQGYDLVLASDTFYPCQKESVYDVVRKIYHSLNLGGIFVSKHWVHISATSGHPFRNYPDSITELSGQRFGNIRTPCRVNQKTGILLIR